MTKRSFSDGRRIGEDGRCCGFESDPDRIPLRRGVEASQQFRGLLAVVEGLQNRVNADGQHYARHKWPKSLSYVFLYDRQRIVEANGQQRGGYGTGQDHWHKVKCNPPKDELPKSASTNEGAESGHAYVDHSGSSDASKYDGKSEGKLYFSQ